LIFSRERNGTVERRPSLPATINSPSPVAVTQGVIEPYSKRTISSISMSTVPSRPSTMHVHTTRRARAQRPAATAARWATVIAAAALAACGLPRVAAAAPGGSAPGQRTLTYYAFDINNGTTDPGFIPAPGTSPKVFSQGDELIINDQLTTTHQVNGGYPIVGHDAGVCTLTRIPQHQIPQNTQTRPWRTASSPPSGPPAA
jgi:hypothetical protein